MSCGNDKTAQWIAARVASYSVHAYKWDYHPQIALFKDTRLPSLKKEEEKLDLVSLNPIHEEKKKKKKRKHRKINTEQTRYLMPFKCKGV